MARARPRPKRYCKYPGCNAKLSDGNKTGFCVRHIFVTFGEKPDGPQEHPQLKAIDIPEPPKPAPEPVGIRRARVLVQTMGDRVFERTVSLPKEPWL